MISKTSRKKRKLTTAQENAIARVHALLDEIARELRQRGYAARKGGG